MTEDQFKKLREGDVVRGKSGGESFIVTGNYGGRVTAVRTQDITNAGEFEVVSGPPPAVWSGDVKPAAAGLTPNADPEAEAHCSEPVRAAGFTNLGIKAGAFVEYLNDLCTEHELQIFSFSPMFIQSLIPGENPIDFPEIQDHT